MNDAMIQVISAAAAVRSFELVQKSDLTRQQLQHYLENYQGKYPIKTVEAGIGLLISTRVSEPRTIISKILASFKKPKAESPQRELINKCAMHNLSNPGATEEARKATRNNFTC